jgi:N-acetylmuramoyl-L-alanine amidase
VAARENGTTVGALSELDFILASLTLSYNERYASRLAHHVHTSLARNLRRRWSSVRDLGVKRGPFLVLFQADMPSILVEVGFVSNRTEAPPAQRRSGRAPRGLRAASSRTATTTRAAWSQAGS